MASSGNLLACLLASLELASERFASGGVVGKWGEKNVPVVSRIIHPEKGSMDKGKNVKCELGRVFEPGGGT